MEIDQTCHQHQKQKISWVCLEKVCSQRVMCSTCAVKLHERSHKLEELTNLIENGLLETYVSNQKNTCFGLKILIEGEPEIIQEEAINEDHLGQSIERCLRTVSKKIDAAKKELLLKQEDLRKKNEIDRNKLLSELTQQNHKLKNSTNLGVDIDKAFLSICSFANKKEAELLQNKDNEILIKKIQLLTLMKDNFLKMIKTYFHNQFTAEFCHLFDMQLETLNSKDVQDINGFLDYVDGKWKQDYKNIQYSIEKFIQKLNEGLKYAIQMPLDDKPQKVQQQAFKSPQKPFQQQSFVPTTPFAQIPQVVYQQQQPMYFYPQVVRQQIPIQQQQQQYTSPRKFEGEQDHFTKSQIMYEEPTQKKNIKIEPVSQSLQQYL